ncbi:hypothetical protein FQN52_001015 [Onygenales sp. PD_12]|nr:hypothetical protein FQN52_001015 [Onygenales sp. PD_12]
MADIDPSSCIDDMRRPKLPFKEPATAADIQNLIAAIATLEKRDRAQPQSNSSARDTTDVPPLSSTARVPRRLTKVLDSLAGLLVSNADNEVIATALRVGPISQKITVMISSNTTIPPATCEHASWIWGALREISVRYHKLYPRESSPTHEIEDQEFLDQLSEFRYKCFRFNFAKIQKRVNDEFPLFEKLDLTDLNENHPLRQFSKAIFALERYFTRNEGAVYGKPDENNTKAWNLMKIWFRICQTGVQYISKNGLTPEERLRLSAFPRWGSYFKKITYAMDQVDDILRVSMSQQCRHFFQYKFNLHPVPATMSKAHTVPQSSKDWEDVLERALSRRNGSRLGHNYNEPELKLLKMPTITKDSAYLCQEQIGNDLATHCEVQLLLHIARLESEKPSLAKAYPYLAVSKPSCYGCHLFILAYNRTHETHFMTRGTHGKFSWPWQFPMNFPKHEVTAARMYAILANIWGGHYNGYETERKEPSQDLLTFWDATGPAHFTRRGDPDVLAQLLDSVS